jgi:hypothetical protein
MDLDDGLIWLRVDIVFGKVPEEGAQDAMDLV